MAYKRKMQKYATKKENAFGKKQNKNRVNHTTVQVCVM